ncbi:MAG TPA: M6 family metalloprotease domain-containing protein [Gemmatimonadales bacterium]|nr:M6 family metalloprotease domain-containing protein [Gemmatimonadales bacterium]
MAHAQTDDVTALGLAHGGARPPAGYYAMKSLHPRAFEFSLQNGWIVRAHAVAARRDAWRASALMPGLSAAPTASQPAGGILHGDLNVPAFLILYANTDSTTLTSAVSWSTIVKRLYGTQIAPPYSVTSYYRELSHDSLRVNGTVYPWKRVPGADTLYEGPAGCDGLCSVSGVPRLIEDIVAAEDANVNFGQFDNDGPDGIPNSGDDDGYVDALVLLDPEVGSECQLVTPGVSNNIWAHRYTYSGWTGHDLQTNDPAANGGYIKIRDYIIQGAQGGDNGCTPNQPQAMGVVAHETGHLFGLPDLYDTGPQGTSGIGRWGLMASGGERTPTRPAYMSAWSRATLGWVTEVPITRDTSVVLSPAELSDTALVLPIANTNEYFLLENRQQLGSDVYLYAPGLLVWHVDSVLMRQREPANIVNALSPHALRLEQADGLAQLDLPGASLTNRGDAGDPYPGSTNSTEFGFATTPSSADNSGNPSYVTVSDITQVSPGGAISASILFNHATLIAASDMNAFVSVDSVPYHRFYDVLLNDRSHTVAIDSVQTGDSGRSRFTFLQWSDGLSRVHALPSPPPDTLIASVHAEYRVTASVVGAGNLRSQPAIALDTGTFVTSGTVDTITATATGRQVFDGWTGDSIAIGNPLILTVRRPYTMVAHFVDSLVVPDSARGPDTLVMGRNVQRPVTVTGGRGVYLWTIGGGAVPPGVTFTQTGIIGGLPSATGEYTLSVRVTSGLQHLDFPLTLDVVAPTLATDAVVNAVVGTGPPLPDDDVRYLDLLGNRNGRADVGDFLAWVQATGAPVSAAQAARLASALRKRP